MTLKRNSKAVLDVYASQKTKNASQAYKEIYPTATGNTARNNASQLLKKPEAQIYLQQHIDKASSTIVTLLDAEKPDIQLRAATDILDRSHGKAVQQVQSTGVSVQFSIDLSQAMQELEADTPTE